MPLVFKVVASSLRCEGEGIEFLKFKTELAKTLGSQLISPIDKNSFSLPLNCAVLVIPVIKDIYGYVPDVLLMQSAMLEEHENARLEAINTSLENKILDLEKPWLSILDPAQAVAVSSMTTKGLLGMCLFDEQGIGKTLTMLATFDILFARSQTDSLLIVCPLTMVEEWKKEIDKFLKGKYRVNALSGSLESKRNALFSDFEILICNYESLEPLMVLLKAQLSRRRATLAVDESFNVKNKDANRSKSLAELRKYCVKGFVLCGTPAPNSPIDIINQFDIADGGYTFAGFSPPKDKDDQIQQIMYRVNERGAYIRRLKEDILPNLPKKQFELIQVELAGRQLALYEEAKQKLELTLKSMDNATFKRSLTSYFQQRAVLLQICACPEAIDPTYSDVAAKIPALDKLLTEIVSDKNRKIVIWSYYRNSLAKLYNRYTEYSPVLLDGSISAKDRGDSVRKFQSDPSVRICIANPAAAGAGITLHAASDSVYISFSNQAAHFLQSLDRIHRRGQTAETVNYYLVVCRGTIEEKEVLRLRAKESKQQELLGDRIQWPNSLDEALAELTEMYE